MFNDWAAANTVHSWIVLYFLLSVLSSSVCIYTHWAPEKTKLALIRLHFPSEQFCHSAKDIIWMHDWDCLLSFMRFTWQDKQEKEEVGRKENWFNENVQTFSENEGLMQQLFEYSKPSHFHCSTNKHTVAAMLGVQHMREKSPFSVFPNFIVCRTDVDRVCTWGNTRFISDLNLSVCIPTAFQLRFRAEPVYVVNMWSHYMSKCILQDLMLASWLLTPKKELNYAQFPPKKRKRKICNMC